MKGNVLMNANLLLQGDMLQVCAALPAACVDLLYLDPPFGTGRTFSDVSGSFDDRWGAGIQEYVAWLMQRVLACRRVLVPTGSLFVHLDRRAVHYVKVALDEHWGAACFRNEIIWHYTGGGRARRVFSHKHDTILWYSNDAATWTFNRDALRQPYLPTSGYARSGIRSAAGKHYAPHPQGTPPDDVWDIPMINPMAAERVGYPTQKPERLLRRIITAASNVGETVADLCCGSGTTAVIAHRMGRRWIAADVSAAAVATTATRLHAIDADLTWQTLVPDPA